ncbi:hypothetical protein V1514DRAFT_336460 [Lipomyces japonicus]|uniref:uncharacterized protein n=1 Tax=Lipomyces japonicus TaxID=56871 RepID=UPI0034CE9466
MSPVRELIAGIYVPTLTFFTDDDQVDVAAISRHAVRLAQAGVVGLVTLGSYGEGVLLSNEERSVVTRTTRAALDQAGFTHVPVIAGVTDQSVRGAVELARQAASAGADAILTVPPSYYRSFVTDQVMHDFFTGLADGSPVPVIIYNYPGVTAGVDLTSDLIARLSVHENIIGAKFTCGSSGKLARVAAQTRPVGPLNPDNAITTGGFLCIAGMADFLTQALAVGGTGVISGPANITPKTVVRVFNLFAQKKYDEAFKAQLELSQSDYVLTNLGPEGSKIALQKFFGYGGHVRRPLMKKTSVSAQDEVTEIAKRYIDFENSL